MSTKNLCFEQKYENYQNFYQKIFIFRLVKFSVYLNRHVFLIYFFGSICHKVHFLNLPLKYSFGPYIGVFALVQTYLFQELSHSSHF